MSQYGNYPAPPHDILNRLWIKDKHEHKFLEAVTGNWNNHLPLLILSLRLIRPAEIGIDVLELGSGEGSTPLLRQYCKDQKLSFKSYDNNQEWCAKTGASYVYDWDKVVSSISNMGHALIFIDHAPGERRVHDAIKLANAAEIIVLHDTEEGGAGDYKWNLAWPHFKYRLNYNRLGGGAGATAVSNAIDLNRFRGLKLGEFTFDKD